MSKNSQDRCSKKRLGKAVAINKNNARKIMEKKSVVHGIEDQILMLINIILMWKHRLPALVEQIGDRKKFFMGNDEAAVKRCDAILDTLNMMQLETPAYEDMCKELQTRMGEMKGKIDHVEKGIALMELMDYFHMTGSKFEGVTKRMDNLVRNIHTVLVDEPALPAKPELTDSTIVPGEDVRVLTPEEQKANVLQFKTSTGECDVTEAEAQHIISTVNSEPAGDESIMGPDTKSAQ